MRGAPEGPDDPEFGGRRALAACAVVLCVIAVIGCGASETEQFKAGYAAARAPLNRTFVDVTRAFTHAKGQTLAEIAGSLGALADRFRKELPAFEALKPPGGVGMAFTMLKMCLYRVERDLRRTYVAVKTKDLVAAERALGDLQSDTTAASDAAATVTAKLDHK